ncbi:jg23264, partial [Pararge aegeria aegeria]
MPTLTCCGRPVCVAGGVATGALNVGVVVVLVEPTNAGSGAGAAGLAGVE